MSDVVIVHGSQYKVGKHDRVYRWVNGGWVSSAKNKRELMLAINRAHSYNAK